MNLFEIPPKNITIPITTNKTVQIEHKKLKQFFIIVTRLEQNERYPEFIEVPKVRSSCWDKSILISPQYSQFSVWVFWNPGGPFFSTNIHLQNWGILHALDIGCFGHNCKLIHIHYTSLTISAMFCSGIQLVVASE